MRKQRGATVETQPLAVGTGLVALDVVITEGSDQPARYWAGGTCGNVLLRATLPRLASGTHLPFPRGRSGDPGTA